jgi:hypothetical protein
MLWEDYGFLMYETAPFMAGLTPAEADVSESFLRTRWPELAELDLNYQSESALTLLGLLVTEQAQFDKFVPLAEVMGTSAWQRITRMAEKAQQAGNLALAASVYEAALTNPGMHQDYIQKKYAELTQMATLQHNGKMAVNGPATQKRCWRIYNWGNGRFCWLLPHSVSQTNRLAVASARQGTNGR